ncbi:hypothetical protein RYX51_00510 [Priestia filamentosa]|nr:hypothetical protein RYX51_00510 [Priestia filamentosa]
MTKKILPLLSLNLAYYLVYSKRHFWLLSHRFKSNIGMDGVFLDTVDDIDDYFYNKPALQTEISTAYKTLLTNIKEQDPIKIPSLPYINAVL